MTGLHLTLTLLKFSVVTSPKAAHVLTEFTT